MLALAPSPSQVGEGAQEEDEDHEVQQPCEGPEAAPFPGFPGSTLGLPLVQDIGYDVRPRALRQGGVEERSVRGS